MSLSVGVLTKCLEEAKKSEYRFKVGCVIFKGDRIISNAHNAIRSCSAISMKHRRWINSLHAEQAAILKMKERTKLKGCSVLILKISETKNLLSNAKPCKYCLESLLFYGIKNIYYSNEHGEIVKLLF